MKSTKKFIINLIILVLLIGIFLIVNIYGFENIKTGRITTTTKNVTTTEAPVQDIAYEDIIYVGDEEIQIHSVQFVSHLGFGFKYESEYFEVKHLSNGSVLITNKEDANNYITIEKLQENVYYQEYERLNLKEEINDGYLVNYKFLKGSSYNYLKVTKSAILDNSSLNAHMDYIIHTMSFTSN
ncbi:MAG: hypothetical protein J1F35_05250 [Erysipelotrichales bacterium]|nr:hypothetical protein [Erysipelotrichales bacterium]